MAIEALLAQIKSPVLTAVARHWDEARGQHLMPGWSDIRPSRLATQLPFVWAYTYDAANDRFIGRLAGDRIEAIFAKTFRQTPLEQIFPPREYEDVFQRAKRVVGEPAIFRAEGLVFKQLHRFGYGERLMLPLAGDGAHGDGILGCTVYNSIPGDDAGSLPELDEWHSLARP